MKSGALNRKFKGKYTYLRIKLKGTDVTDHGSSSKIWAFDVRSNFKSQLLMLFKDGDFTESLNGLNQAYFTTKRENNDMRCLYFL